MVGSRLTVAIILFLAFGSLMFALPDAFAQNPPTKYKVEITVTVTNPNGQPRIVKLPVATIPQGNKQTLNFGVGNESFDFDVEVKPNANQVMVARTNGRLKIEGKELATPTIEQRIGSSAQIKTTDIELAVTYTPVAQ